MSIDNSSLSNIDINTVLHPYTELSSHQKNGPKIITSGKGIYVYDDAGNKYIEGLSGLWCTTLGFQNQRIVNAAKKAMERLPFYHCFGGKSHPNAIKLAEILTNLAPNQMSKVFFANSGSEANDTAIKIVWHINNARGLHNKKKIIARHKSYHGVTLFTSGLTGLPNNHRDFDVPFERIMHTDCPHYYRYAFDDETEDNFTNRLVSNLRALIEKEGPDTIAAFIAEPVMGAGGVIPPPESYFPKIQPLLKEYDILFIADEVICGFGRTGNMFGSETYDLKPDIITVAKGLSSGYLPISGLMITEEIFDLLLYQSKKIGVFGHGFTYGGHPVSCAVALEALKIYEETNLINHVQEISPIFETELRTLETHPLVGEVRQIGMLGAIEIVKNKMTKEPFNTSDKIGPLLVELMQKNGLISRAMGDSIAFAPPLIINEKQIQEMVLIVQRSIMQLHEMLVQNDKLGHS
jgi:4-aminobutyrate---pyruvate transaminase